MKTSSQLKMVAEQILESKRKKKMLAKQSQQNQPYKKARKKERPRKNKRRKLKARSSVGFQDTKLGRFLMVNTPVEYNIIYETISRKGYFGSVGYVVKIVESIAYMSDNPAFRSPKFRAALIEFKKTGFKPNKKEEWGIRDVLKVSKIQHEMMGL